MDQDRIYGQFIDNIRIVGTGFSDMEHHLPDSVPRAPVHRNKGYLAEILVPVSAAAVVCLCIFLSGMRSGSERVTDTEAAVMISRSLSDRPAGQAELARIVALRSERRQVMSSMSNLDKLHTL